MNRTLQWLNLGGVVVLAALCAWQWHIHGQLNREINALEKLRLEHTQKIEEQAKSLSAQAADLEQFRDQLGRTTDELSKVRGMARKTDRELRRTAEERDQLKASIAEWSAAVTLRDERLREANDTIADLSARLTTSVEKHNALAEQYNDIVGQYNTLVEQAATAQAATAPAPATP